MGFRDWAGYGRAAGEYDRASTEAARLKKDKTATPQAKRAANRRKSKARNELRKHEK